MPFCHLSLSAKKPSKLPKTLDTWGDHIKKRRLELGLYQRELAERLGVHGSTVTNWELDRSGPALRLFPRIIEFLGYVPDVDRPLTVDQEIVCRRRLLGLSQKKLAKLLGVDPSTLGRWENGGTQPSEKLSKRLEEWSKERGF